jgi:lipoate-protein ligase B
MMTNEELMEIYEAMVHQQKLLLDTKIQVESLKAMMFEHRPAFTEAFAQQVSKIMQTPQIQQMQSQIAELETKLGGPR